MSGKELYQMYQKILLEEHDYDSVDWESPAMDMGRGVWIKLAEELKNKG